MAKEIIKKHLIALPIIILFAIIGTTLLSFSSAGPSDPNDPNYPLADTNGDSRIDIFDLSYVLSNWNGSNATADFNGDNTVSIFDLSYLLAQWGRVDTPGGGGETQMASSVSQYGITWTFDTEYLTGQFANGDYWVQGPMTLTATSPAASGGRHGFEVNPTVHSTQGLDSRVGGYGSGLMPGLPAVVGPDSSIVKAVSDLDAPGAAEGCRPCLETAAVLTVVAAPPTDNGATVFRPSYFGSQKTYHSTQGLRTDLLPSLAPAGNEPSLADVERDFERVQIDYRQGWTARAIHPSENMPNYGSDILKASGDGALRLMLNDSLEEKMPALVNYVQTGIDHYALMQGGMRWPADGGHMHGRKLPIVFAATMLDSQAMKTAISSAPYNTFSEDGHLYFSQQADGGNGKVLYGKQCTESFYWNRINNNSGSRDCRDPYGYVDGGGTEIGGAYQYCCTSLPWKGAALALVLMPELSTVWDYGYFVDYVDRWVNHGVWALPDPCALTTPSSYTGQCVPGSGRFAPEHGTDANSGHYGSSFAGSMWSAYR